MNRILMAAAVALVSGAPLAFAASGEAVNNADLSTLHCANLKQEYSANATPESSAARQLADQKAESMCKQNKDHDTIGMRDDRREPSPARILVIR